MTKSADPGGANGEAGVKKGKIAFASVDSLVETKCALKVSPEPPKRPPPATPGLFLRGGGEEGGKGGLFGKGGGGAEPPETALRSVLDEEGMGGGGWGGIAAQWGLARISQPNFSLSPFLPPPFSR